MNRDCNNCLALVFSGLCLLQMLLQGYIDRCTHPHRYYVLFAVFAGLCLLQMLLQGYIDRCTHPHWYYALFAVFSGLCLLQMLLQGYIDRCTHPHRYHALFVVFTGLCLLQMLLQGYIDRCTHPHRYYALFGVFSGLCLLQMLLQGYIDRCTHPHRYYALFAVFQVCVCYRCCCKATSTGAPIHTDTTLSLLCFRSVSAPDVVTRLHRPMHPSTPILRSLCCVSGLCLLQMLLQGYIDRCTHPHRYYALFVVFQVCVCSRCYYKATSTGAPIHTDTTFSLLCFRSVSAPDVITRLHRPVHPSTPILCSLYCVPGLCLLQMLLQGYIDRCTHPHRYYALFAVFQVCVCYRCCCKATSTGAPIHTDTTFSLLCFQVCVCSRCCCKATSTGAPIHTDTTLSLLCFQVCVCSRCCCKATSTDAPIHTDTTLSLVCFQVCVCYRCCCKATSTGAPIHTDTTLSLLCFRSVSATDVVARLHRPVHPSTPILRSLCCVSGLCLLQMLLQGYIDRCTHPHRYYVLFAVFSGLCLLQMLLQGYIDRCTHPHRYYALFTVFQVCVCSRCCYKATSTGAPIHTDTTLSLLCFQVCVCSRCCCKATSTGVPIHTDTTFSLLCFRSVSAPDVATRLHRPVHPSTPILRSLCCVFRSVSAPDVVTRLHRPVHPSTPILRSLCCVFRSVSATDVVTRLHRPVHPSTPILRSLCDGRRVPRHWSFHIWPRHDTIAVQWLWSNERSVTPRSDACLQLTASWDQRHGTSAQSYLQNPQFGCKSCNRL